MLLGAISVECFHCVDFRQVHSTRHTGEYLKSIAGTVCPICETRTETYMLLADTEDYKKVRDNTGTWNLGTEPTEGFGTFTTTSSSASRGSSAAAAHLRGQLLEQADRRKKVMCEAITDFAQAKVTLSVGCKAKEAGQLAKARRALEVCAGTGKPEAFEAAFHLGELAEMDRDLAVTMRWYRQAAGTAEAPLRAAATLYLGMALRRSGDLDGAKEAFQRCIDCGTAPMQGMAALRLGDLRYEQSDRQGAREAYEFTVSLRDKLSCSPDAALSLGALEEEGGNWDRARSLWDYAHKAGEPETGRLAAFNLGRLWAGKNHKRKARTFYEIALRSADPAVVAHAKAYLSIQ